MTSGPDFDGLDSGGRAARSELADRYAKAGSEERRRLLDAIAVRAAAGSRSATELLVVIVHRHRLAVPPITDVLIDPADIDDAAQLTLIAVAERIGRFEGRAPFRSWLRTVARNEALQVLRRKRRTHEDQGAELPDDGDFVRRLSSVVANEFLVRQALDRVSEPFREALIMREVRQLDYAEIADLLGVPVGTVRSRIARARAQLAEQVWQL